MEDVADNMVSSQLARGEKESMVIRALCETLSKTGSSSEIVATTMMSALKRVLSETKSDCDIMKAIGNTMHEQGTESEYIHILKYTMQSFRKELQKYFILAGGIQTRKEIYHKNPVKRPLTLAQHARILEKMRLLLNVVLYISCISKSSLCL